MSNWPDEWRRAVEHPACKCPTAECCQLVHPPTPADLAARLNATSAAKKPVYGMCLACRAVEVELYDVIGTRDLSHMGEHPRYPVGYGCEVCS